MHKHAQTCTQGQKSTNVHKRAQRLILSGWWDWREIRADIFERKPYMTGWRGAIVRFRISQEDPRNCRIAAVRAVGITQAKLVKLLITSILN
jgi:hypothetical protein